MQSDLQAMTEMKNIYSRKYLWDLFAWFFFSVILGNTFLNFWFCKFSLNIDVYSPVTQDMITNFVIIVKLGFLKFLIVLCDSGRPGRTLKSYW